MRHCNSVFQSEDIWFLLDNENEIKRKLYLAFCPICGKEMALYSSFNLKDNTFFEKYYYSNGAKKIKQRLKKDTTSTMLGFKKYKAPYGFIYGKNTQITRNGKIIGTKQYSCDFWGNKVLVKKIINE